jgi:aminoglycoside phosphotransferase (APT) family kinase protein
MRSRSESEALTRLAAALVPGGRALSLRRLAGGIGARMHALTVDAADGARTRVALRRYVPGRGNHGSPEAAAREFRTLGLLAERGISAPKPLLLDLEGAYFDVPTIVESLVPGRTVVSPAEPGAWTRGLAAALTSVHRLTPANADLSHLNTFLRAGTQEELGKGIAGHSTRSVDLSKNPLALKAHEALVAALPAVTWLEPCLVHDDYYPGNVMWSRGRVSGIVDWTTAEVGDRRADVAQCALDLAMMHGLDVADRFVAAYEALSGARLPDVDFWLLFRGLRAYGSYAAWLKGYHDLGLKHLTLDHLRSRVEAVLERSLGNL